MQNGEIPKDLFITLERTYCFGSCPAYKLTINSQGEVDFEGKEYTKKIGSAKSKIKREKVRQLIREFEKADFFSFRGRYDDFDVCEVYATDSPSEIISIRINGKNKEVYHYFGCGGKKVMEELEPLINLGEKIDLITNSKRWIGERK